MPNLVTLTDILCSQKNRSQPSFFTYEAGQQTHAVSPQIIYQTAMAAAAVIQQQMPANSNMVLLEGRNHIDFIYCFFAIQLAGGVPVPIPTDLWIERYRYLDMLSSIQKTTEAGLAIVSARTQSIIDSAGLDFRAVTTEEIHQAAHADTGENKNWKPYAPSASDTAYLQFSSGSTGQPKGVIISHANAMANIRQIIECLSITDKDISLSWLPLHHDMGLLAGFLIPIFSGTASHIMTPYDFATSPSRWLRSVSSYKATFIVAPNSAFHLAQMRIRPKTISQLDLSSLRTAICAAEPIYESTLSGFADAFKSAGFNPNAMVAGYGLAENTLAVSFSDLRELIHVDYINNLVVDGQAVAEKASQASHDLAYVSCGKPLKGTMIKILDDQGEVLAERYIGHIVIQSPATSVGYYRRDDLNKDLFCHGMLRTGDIGYIANGELYITGREKDMIIINGQNINAESVENYACQSPDMSLGKMAAFAVSHQDAQSERVHIVVEYEKRLHGRQSVGGLKKAIAQYMSGFIALKEEHVSILTRGAILKTTSGKVKRQLMRERYEQGLLEEVDV